MKRVAFAAALIVALSCAKEAPAPALTKVRLNLTPSLTYAPLVIAKEEGFFAAEGIDAELVNVDSSSALLSLNTGELDVFSGGIRMGMFNLMAKQMPLRIVADKGHSHAGPCTNEAMVAPVKTAERIAAAGGNPRGERVAVTRGGLTEYLTDQFLARHQLTVADVTIVEVPQGTAASMRQEIDAIRHLTDPYLTTALAEKRVSIIATGEELSPGHQTAVLVYGKRLLRDDRALGKRFMRAYLRGVRRYNEGKTPRNVDIISRFTKLAPDAVRNACWIAIANDGRIAPDAVERILRWSLTRGYLDRPMTRDQWWDPSFL